MGVPKLGIPILDTKFRDKVCKKSQIYDSSHTIWKIYIIYYISALVKSTISLLDWRFKSSASICSKTLSIISPMITNDGSTIKFMNPI